MKNLCLNLTSLISKRRIVLVFAVVFLIGGWDFALPFQASSNVQAQTNKRNVFETKRSITPSRPRPKADEETTQALRQGMGKGFMTGFSDGNLYLYLGFFVILFTVIVGLVYYDANYRQHHSNLENPWIVFRELCKAHQLTWTEAKFLKKLAVELDLDDPLPLFIEPRYFVGALENKALESSKPTIQYLLKKFFGIKPGQETSFQTQIIDDHSVGMNTVMMDETVVRKPTSIIKPNMT